MSDENLTEDWRLGVAKNLRERRSDLQLTQQELSKRSGVHQSVISKIEKRGLPLSFHNLYRLAHGLNCGIGRLLPPHSEDATVDLTSLP